MYSRDCQVSCARLLFSMSHYSERLRRRADEMLLILSSLPGFSKVFACPTQAAAPCVPQSTRHGTSPPKPTNQKDGDGKKFTIFPLFFTPIAPIHHTIPSFFRYSLDSHSHIFFSLLHSPVCSLSLTLHEKEGKKR